MLAALVATLGLLHAGVGANMSNRPPDEPKDAPPSVPETNPSEHVEKHVLRRLELAQRLGRGAYGVVWKVIEKRSRSVIALKKCFDAFRNATDAQRTYREVSYLRELTGHENIIRLQHIIKADNDLDIYLTFDYMETDLHAVIRAQILSPMHEKYICYQLLKALKYVHSAMIVHRDVKVCRQTNAHTARARLRTTTATERMEREPLRSELEQGVAPKPKPTRSRTRREESNSKPRPATRLARDRSRSRARSTRALKTRPAAHEPKGDRRALSLVANAPVATRSRCAAPFPTPPLSRATTRWSCRTSSPPSRSRRTCWSTRRARSSCATLGCAARCSSPTARRPC